MFPQRPCALGVESGFQVPDGQVKKVELQEGSPSHALTKCGFLAVDADATSNAALQSKYVQEWYGCERVSSS